MRAERLLIWLLVLATLHVDAVFFAYAPRSALALYGLIALERSQVSLVALWLALGGSWLPMRVMGTTIAVSAWIVAFYWLGDFLNMRDARIAGIVVFSVAVHVLAVAYPCCLARCMGLRVSGTAGEGADVDGAPKAARLQFSIGYLLAWMTALAVVLSAIKTFATLEPPKLASVLHGRAFQLLVSDVAIALVCAWAVLKIRSPWWQVVALAAGYAAVLAGLSLGAGFQSGSWVFPIPAFAVICLLEMLLLGTSLWVVRLAGYRLIVSRRRG